MDNKFFGPFQANQPVKTSKLELCYIIYVTPFNLVSIYLIWYIYWLDIEDHYIQSDNKMKSFYYYKK